MPWRHTEVKVKRSVFREKNAFDSLSTVVPKLLILQARCVVRNQEANWIHSVDLIWLMGPDDQCGVQDQFE